MIGTMQNKLQTPKVADLILIRLCFFNVFYNI